jgi:hypothetical protein
MNSRIFRFALAVAISPFFLLPANAQNVGINTTTPDRPLSVQSNASGGGIGFKNSSGTSTFFMDNYLSGLGIFRNGVAMPDLHITSTGKVGIGLENPVPQFEIQNTSGSGFIFNTKRQSGQNALLVNADGLVGINLIEPDPNYPLTIKDRNNAWIGLRGGAINWTISTSNINSFLIGVEGNLGEGINMLADGRVGIAGPASGSVLTVNNPNNVPDLFKVVDNAGLEVAKFTQDGCFGYYQTFLSSAFSVKNLASKLSAFTVRNEFNVPKLEVLDADVVLVSGGASFVVAGGGTKNFVIDHPLDPENKKLYHSCIEAPEQMTVYRGNAICEADGSVWVRLPDYFEALNADYSYQLTCIEGYAPVYIGQKVAQNRFKISGGTSGLEVAWQVTGRRNDQAVQNRPYQVEVDKTPHERGRYYAPEAYGKSYKQGIRYEEPQEDK